MCEMDERYIKIVVDKDTRWTTFVYTRANPNILISLHNFSMHSKIRVQILISLHNFSMHSKRKGINRIKVVVLLLIKVVILLLIKVVVLLLNNICMYIFFSVENF
jgi:hypothetical protein